MHNLWGFDYIFILSALSYYGDEFKLAPIIKEENNLLVSLKVTKKIEVVLVNKKNPLNKSIKHINRTIKILDSNQIIPGKLRDLAKSFNCNNLKGHFPYKFLNLNNLNYCGDLPQYEYFDDLSLEEYNNWNEKIKKIGGYDIKNELIKYLKKDLKSLNEILIIFNKYIFNNYGINITKIKSISSLAINIYLSNFYRKKYNIKNQVYRYSGGQGANMKGQIVPRDPIRTKDFRFCGLEFFMK